MASNCRSSHDRNWDSRAAAQSCISHASHTHRHRRFTPRGQPDVTARLLAPKLTEALGQQVVVDNQPGAGGVVGACIVASPNADGHTLLSVSSAHVVAPLVHAQLGYDPI